ncbi:MAG: S8 family serine peptidase [Actinobacteria bacterium]|nr:S8 family serine peptidase [Actinomycetota bacterium]
MHARRTGWQSLAIFALAVLSVVTGVAAAIADADPDRRRNADVVTVPELADDGTATGGGRPRVRDIRSTLYDVTAIPVPAADGAVTVAYTVERAGEAEIVTTRAADLAAADELVDELRSSPRVAAAEIDTVFAALGEGERSEPVGGDPERDRQWGLDLLDAEKTFTRGNACGQTIAVIDSGVDGGHPDLQGVVRTGKNLVSRGIGATDRSGHGTEVAGVAAAAHGNGTGISGMAPGARVLPVGIEDAAGQMHASDLAQAIKYAIEHDATVINLSLGGPVRSPNVEYWLERAHEAGISVIASAGNAYPNDNPTIWPAASPWTIAVAAVAPTRVWAPFSSTGEYVDLAAPGVAVLTTARGGGYVAGNGTSLAAPFVSAAAAMLRAKDEALTPQRVRELLIDTATDVGPTGRDARFGHGIVDPAAALRTLDGPPAPCFVDIDDLTLANQIERLGLAGVTDGCARRRFCPARAVTRGQMATFLARAISQPATDADFFSDDDASPHEVGINRLAQANIARGCTGTRFCPHTPVTRGQMAALISRALDLPSAGVDAFADDGRNQHEAAINALAAADITSGCDAGRPDRFCPDDTVTRAQMAAFLARMMDHGSDR